MLPGLLGIGVTQINVLIGSAFASMSGKGAVTAYYLSDRLLEFLLGVYAVSISTAILPSLARRTADGKWENYYSLLGLGLRMVLFLAIPASVGLVLLRQPIISTLFQHGRFDSDSTQLTAIPLLFSSAGLCAFAALRVIVPSFYARHDTRTPVFAAGIAFMVNIVANVLLLRPLGVAGPAVAAVSAGWINCLYLYRALRANFPPGFEKGLGLSISRSLAATVPTGILLYWAAQKIFWIGSTPLERIIALSALVILAITAYFAAAWAFRCREFFEIAAFFRQSMLQNMSKKR
jgi:putative peptidoglycan lipid II flippase